MWNERYAEPGYAYGTAPNDFVVECLPLLKSPVLCLASGEGRNAVWLAEQGLEVYAVDGSSVGVQKTRRLAAERGVTVYAQVADLADFELGQARWGSVVAIFAHLPPPIRRRVYAAIAPALRTGGVLVLEGYTPRQLGRRGGPPVAPMLLEPEVLRQELVGLELERCEELEREVVEGRFHDGKAFVVQVVGRRA